MSDVIDFMERMGGDAQLSHASTDELAVVLSPANLSPELQSAVLAKDAQRLGVLLGTEAGCILVAPPHPPGPGPSPALPSVPPPPPGEDGEEGSPTDCFEHDGVVGISALRRGRSTV
jgi:hypothetical protein